MKREDACLQSRAGSLGVVRGIRDAESRSEGREPIFLFDPGHLASLRPHIDQTRARSITNMEPATERTPHGRLRTAPLKKLTSTTVRRPL